MLCLCCGSWAWPGAWSAYADGSVEHGRWWYVLSWLLLRLRVMWQPDLTVGQPTLTGEVSRVPPLECDVIGCVERHSMQWTWLWRSLR